MSYSHRRGDQVSGCHATHSSNEATWVSTLIDLGYPQMTRADPPMRVLAFSVTRGSPEGKDCTQRPGAPEGPQTDLSAGFTFWD
jgi:hypothetical protein